MHFTVEAQRIAAQYLHEGSIAVDATAGNGFDTLYLARAVGPSGVVYACDIQSQAIEQTLCKLQKEGIANRVTLRVQSHDSLDQLVEPHHHGMISVAMFNLGYLPFGDKSLTTQSDSTVSALEKSLRMLRIGGLLVVLVYRGHSGGDNEAQEVEAWMHRNQQLNSVKFHTDSSNSKSPVLWWLERTTVD
jgi:predicted methyltransferase